MNLYKGGLAEIVATPTDITYSFLLHWFSGTGSLGTAWKLVNIPFRSLPVSVLTRIDNELFTDLDSEEKLLYGNTILSYLPLVSPTDQPKLTLSFKKIIHPYYLYKTFQIILRQSQWISHSEQTIHDADLFLEKIPQVRHMSLEILDATITHEVLPFALAIDYLHEFFQALLLQKLGNDQQVQSYIYQQVRKKDWIFQSIDDQYRVKIKELSFDEYLSQYGMRADDDYELGCPRWHEEPEKIQKKIETITSPKDLANIDLPKKHTNLIDCVITLSILRTESRKKTLPWINELRHMLIKQLPDGEKLQDTTRKHFGLSEQITFSVSKPSGIVSATTKGIGVSPGIVSGKTKRITSPSDIIPPSCIAIFPNATPMYASLYSQCAGIIFLSGGRTSHGVIVSREYGIPAIIAPHTDISDNTTITLDGTNGTFTIS